MSSQGFLVFHLMLKDRLHRESLCKGYIARRGGQVSVLSLELRLVVQKLWRLQGGAGVRTSGIEKVAASKGVFIQRWKKIMLAQPKQC